MKEHKLMHAEQHGHDHEDGADNDVNDLSDVFSFFQHTNAKGNEYSIPGIIHLNGGKLIKAQILQSPQFEIACDAESPPLLAVQRYDPLLSQNVIPYFFSLKAPPLI